jgi:hypothetical protein
MEEQTKTFWWKFWSKPVRFFLCITAISVFGWFASGFYFDHASRGPNWSSFPGSATIAGFFLASILSALGLILSAIPWTRPAMSWALRRWFFCVAALATLIALFYAEEDWRGKRAWEQCKRDMDARGFEVDWAKHFPEPVPDDQNIFKAPNMQEWFVGRGSSAIVNRLASRQTDSISGKTNAIVTEAQARDYLSWSDQFAPDFNLIREALKRPYARMDGDYSQPANMPIPNFVAARQLARTLAQRAHANFILQQPDKALEEVTLLHDMCRMFQGAPTAKPMTLVGAMINVAVTGLYVDTIGEGFKLRAWREPQLVALQEQLKETRLMPFVIQAFHDEPAAIVRDFAVEPHKILDALNSSSVPAAIKLNFIAPRGWQYQNLVNLARYSVVPAGSFDPDGDFVLPAAVNENGKRLEAFLSHKSPFNIYAAIGAANFRKAIMTTAKNQNFVNQALVACGLERYHIAHNQYPESLAALVPQFLEKLPPDVINGGDLKYRRTDNSFVLYSIGWNEKDDGGTAALNKDGSTDWENGDWVWPHAPK